MNPFRFGASLWRLLGGRPQIPPTLKANHALQLILKRRSVRTFSAQPIPDDAWAAILEAGRLAPCTVNLQTWSFMLFDAASWRNRFGASLPFRGQKAVIVLGDYHRARSVIQAFPSSPMIEYTIAVMNASLAAMNMNNAAEALGISSVMLSETGRSGLLDIAYLAEKLALPDGVFPLTTIVFGYARGPYPPMPPKLSLNQITHTGTYHEPDAAEMTSWYDQMLAGYQASHITASFNDQLEVYQAKVGQAEATLRQMVLNESPTRPLSEDQAATWFHGSPLKLSELRAGSTITSSRDLARVFSHKPELVSFGDDGLIRHNGKMPGNLYAIAEEVRVADITPHPGSRVPGLEWLTTRPLTLRLVDHGAPRSVELLTEPEQRALQTKATESAAPKELDG
ncbi:MAG: nitroreductase family protein [Anaerolineae bacterium]